MSDKKVKTASAMAVNGDLPAMPPELAAVMEATKVYAEGNGASQKGAAQRLVDTVQDETARGGDVQADDPFQDHDADEDAADGGKKGRKPKKVRAPGEPVPLTVRVPPAWDVLIEYKAKEAGVGKNALLCLFIGAGLGVSTVASDVMNLLKPSDILAFIETHKSKG